jgi:hypothetical protein
MWPGLPMWAGLVAVPVVIPQSSVRSALSDLGCRTDVGPRRSDGDGKPVRGRIDGSAFGA